MQSMLRAAEMDMGPFFFTQPINLWTQPNPTQPTMLTQGPNPTHPSHTYVKCSHQYYCITHILQVLYFTTMSPQK